MSGRIEVLQGDITQIDVDAIVNAANNDLVLGGGVAGAIRRAGGPSIQKECDKIGPIPLGEAAITGAGHMKIRYVIHAASMGWNVMTNEETLAASTRNSLLRAEEKQVRSIAFPAIGTGIAGFPVGECARLMVKIVREHLAKGSNIERVVFVLFDQQTYKIFKQEIEKTS